MHFSLDFTSHGSTSPLPNKIRVKGPSSEILKFHKEPIRKVVCGAYGTVKICLPDKGRRKKFYF